MSRARFGCNPRCDCLPDVDARIGELEAEVDRLREGWMMAMCGANSLCTDCNETCPLETGEYCEAVRKAVEA